MRPQTSPKKVQAKAVVQSIVICFVRQQLKIINIRATINKMHSVIIQLNCALASTGLIEVIKLK